MDNLWAQGMDSDCVNVGQGTHQMMTFTWFLQDLQCSSLWPFDELIPVSVHVAHLGLVLLTHIPQPFYSHHFHLFVPFYLQGSLLFCLLGKAWYSKGLICLIISHILSMLGILYVLKRPKARKSPSFLWILQSEPYLNSVAYRMVWLFE